MRRNSTRCDSLARPPRPERLLLPTVVVRLEIELVCRGMKAGRTSIRTRVAVIGGGLKRPTWEIEPFLHREMHGNPLTTRVVYTNNLTVS